MNLDDGEYYKSWIGIMSEQLKKLFPEAQDFLPINGM